MHSGPAVKPPSSLPPCLAAKAAVRARAHQAARVGVGAVLGDIANLGLRKGIQRSLARSWYRSELVATGRGILGKGGAEFTGKTVFSRTPQAIAKYGSHTL